MQQSATSTFFRLPDFFNVKQKKISGLKLSVQQRAISENIFDINLKKIIFIWVKKPI